jgi:hypothetical protein
MKYLILIILLLTSINTFASKSEFCTGFEEGYKSIKGDMILVPLCPLEPLTPIGTTPFREGIKSGIRAAS